ncbi:MAG: DUF1295 domain-containing protein [Ruminococcaceae bacterium]|jgi:steroid 5-alpha reductase family enzyme|nr:DUF1295 domain-containing protein [Oscillospiraceae bacterium]
MKTRLTSFGMICTVYAAATVCGVAIYLALPFDYRISLLIADVCATVFVFFFSVIFRNASVYDPYWSVAPIIILTGFALTSRLTAYTLPLLFVVWIWGLRLTANWAYTFHGPKYEDWRYQMLREKTGSFYPIVNLFGIHLFPTLVVYACILPAVVAIHEERTGTLLSFVCLLICLFAVILQGVADYEMHRFRRRGTGGLIRDGLWKYARHPNYLGEILMWWGVGLSFVASGGSVFCLAGAVINHLMFLFISIPMADKRQSQKKGWDGYRAETRMLIPVKKRRSLHRA